METREGTKGGSESHTTARQKLACSGRPVVAVLEGKKAARFNARTMLMPSPLQLKDAIAKIAHGSSMTLREIREALAKESGADVTCPRAATLGWLLVAEAAEEDRAEGFVEVTPWWRVTRDGKPEPRLPGGVNRHRSLLKAEGISL